MKINGIRYWGATSGVMGGMEIPFIAPISIVTKNGYNCWGPIYRL